MMRKQIDEMEPRDLGGLFQIMMREAYESADADGTPKLRPGLRPRNLARIVVERDRQAEEEGYDAIHDAGHTLGAWIDLIANYTMLARFTASDADQRTKRLVQVGALVLAALEALDNG